MKTITYDETQWKLVPIVITEEMHIAATKVLLRAHGLDGTLQRMIDAALSVAPEPPAVDGWVPIDSAPKDCLVDIWCNGKRYAKCHYDVICAEFRHITACGVLVCLKKATYWMHMPPPPKGE